MARPTGVTILAVLSFIGAIFSLIGGCVMLAVGTAGLAAMSAGRGGSMGGPLAMFGAFTGVIFLGLGVLYVINGVGLLKLMAWARLLTIILILIGIVFELLAIFHAIAPFRIGLIIWELILMAIDVWILAYLFKPHVKQAFGAA